MVSTLALGSGCRKNRVAGNFRMFYIGGMMTTEEHHDYQRVERALGFLETHRSERPSLEEAAAHVNLSPFHFQRLFSRWAGISPKRFLQFLTAEHARRCLTETRSVLDAALDTGLSSPGRLHDLTVSVDAVTPGEMRNGGAGLRIRHGSGPSPFGPCFMAVTDRGVCWMSFPGNEDPPPVEELRRHFHRAELVEGPAEIRGWRDRIFSGSSADGAPLSLLMSGTNFQLKVWEALLRVPAGGLCSYGDLASAMGRPAATRAVASAVAANHVAYLIPCHRVIRSMGAFGQYRWGGVRKAAIIGWEQARCCGASSG